MPHAPTSGRRPAPMLLALLAILLWSTLAALTTRLDGLPPFLLAGTSLLIGSLAGVPRWRRWRAPLPMLALGVYGLFAYHAALFMALRLAPPIEANLLNYLWPLLIVVLTPAFLRERRLTARQIAAALLGFAGAALLVTGGRVAFDRAHAAGYALAIAAAVIWSTYSLASARRRDAQAPPVSFFSAVSGLLALLCHALFEPRAVFVAADVPWLLLLGLGPMGAAFLAWDAALRRGDPRTIGLLSYLTPVLSTLLLALAGGGRLSGVSLAAMVLVVGGALLGTWPAGVRTARASATPSRGSIGP
ncbi:MAG: DMT family transporter [bacterium]|nr:DMT family transporter [bacterium]